jgi:nucleoside-diphosphate-sugar epimerase
VGSEADISIGDLAHRIAQGWGRFSGLANGSEAVVRIRQKPDTAKRPPRYVPSCQKATRDLHLKETIKLDEAIQKMFAFESAKARK